MPRAKRTATEQVIDVIAELSVEEQRDVLARAQEFHSFCVKRDKGLQKKGGGASEGNLIQSAD